MSDDHKDISKMSKKEFLEYQRDLEKGGGKAKEKAARDIMGMHADEELKKAEEKLNEEIFRELGVSLADLEREQAILDKNSTAGRELKDFLDAINQGKSARAKRLSGKKGVRGAAKAAKDRDGCLSCSVLGLLMIGAILAGLYGMYEGISAVASALLP